jgi:hypothetical protein
VYAPRTHQGFHVSPSVKPFLYGLAAIVLTVAAWAAFAARSTSNEAAFSISVSPPASTVRSVAYAVPRAGFDAVYIRDVDGASSPLFVASFPTILNWRLRGFASPLADRLALLRVDSIEGTTARLTVLDLPGGQTSEADGVFDYDSAVAWSASGTLVSAVRSSGDTGHRSSSVIQYDTDLRTTSELAIFDDVVEVAPVGYTLDDTSLLVVVVDQSGSSLWSVREGSKQRIARFSAGPTAQWTLSPDGARLAFVDRVGLGTRTYAGRVLLLASGAVSDVSAKADQLGTAWRPGSVTPDFGGPGGSLQLTQPEGAEYVVPVGWSPDGRSLVAEVYSGDDTSSADSPSLELVSATTRQRLADDDGALFFGWVRDVD